MSGKWDDPSVPKKDWVEIGQEDLGSDPDDHICCEMCCAKTIRYVHSVRHLDYHENLDVGTECVKRLLLDPTASVEKNKALRNRAVRRVTWLKRRWKLSSSGNPRLKIAGKFLTVFPQNGGFVGVYDGKYTKTYVTEEAAKLAAFDSLIPKSLVKLTSTSHKRL